MVGHNTTCKAENCAKNAVTKGYCVSHGGERTCKKEDCTAPGRPPSYYCKEHAIEEGVYFCTVEGCSNIQKRKDFCVRHYNEKNGILVKNSYKKRCAVDGCENFAQRKGLCISHGGCDKCSFSGCSSIAVVRGVCLKHDTSGASEQSGSSRYRKTCTVNGCETFAQRGGLCMKHGGVLPCAVNGCEQRSFRKGYCKSHTFTRDISTCAFDSCGDKNERHGFCKHHYSQERSIGMECEVRDCKAKVVRGTSKCHTHSVEVLLPHLICKLDTCSTAATFDGYCGHHHPDKRKGKRKYTPPQSSSSSSDLPPDDERCVIEGCTRKRGAKRMKLCRHHHDTKKGCKKVGCKTPPLRGGWCKKHGEEAAQKKAEDTGEKWAYVGGSIGRLCSVEGCELLSQFQGLCTGHGGVRSKCSVGDCNKKAIKKGKCRDHGDADKCKHDGCTNYAHVRGFCSRHDELSLCECGKPFVSCKEHHGKSMIWCRACDTSRVRSGDHYCRACLSRFLQTAQKHEDIYREVFRSWGFHPSSENEMIRDSSTCDVAMTDSGKRNTRRADFVFLDPGQIGYHIVAECDEQAHRYYNKECEEKRMQDVADQLIANQGNVSKVLFIRFNPDKEGVDEELRQVMTDATQGVYKDGFDMRGIQAIYLGYE